MKNTPTIISIANQKGGVSKTTTAVNLAAGLTRYGNKVLLIDLDPQSNLSSYLGYEPNGNNVTISALMNEVLNGNVQVENTILRNKEGLEYIPSDIQLSSAEIFLINVMSRETVLKRLLRQECFKEYDYIIIDCLPSLGILMVNALTASDYVIVPVQAQKFALDGLSLFLNAFNMIKENLNNQLELLGVVVTMYDKTNMAKAVKETLREQFQEQICSTMISRSVDATNSTYLQKSLVSAPKSKLGKQYIALTNELLNRMRLWKIHWVPNIAAYFSITNFHCEFSFSLALTCALGAHLVKGGIENEN